MLFFDTNLLEPYLVDLNPKTFTWGTMILGTNPWGGGNYQKDLQLSIGSTKGKRVQFMFSNKNTINQRFKVHWFNFTYNLKGQR